MAIQDITHEPLFNIYARIDSLLRQAQETKPDNLDAVLGGCDSLVEREAVKVINMFTHVKHMTDDMYMSWLKKFSDFMESDSITSWEFDLLLAADASAEVAYTN